MHEHDKPQEAYPFYENSEFNVTITQKSILQKDLRNEKKNWVNKNI